MTNIPVCSSAKILLHIGYHKTATTWFQQEVFSNGDLGFHLCQQPRSCVHMAFCQNSLRDSEDNPHLNDIVNEAILATSNGKTFVLSHERLSGYPASGGFDSVEIANRLKNHFPNASVFYMVREQSSIILSAWRQQIIDGGGLTLKQFLNPPEQHIARMPLFRMDMYKYSHLYNRYKKLFSEDRVLCVPYELFSLNQADTVSRIVKLMNDQKYEEKTMTTNVQSERKNPSLSPSIVALLRVANIFLTKNQLSQNGFCNIGTRRVRGIARMLSRYGGSTLCSPLDRVFQSSAKKKISGRIKGFYSKDNTNLGQALDVDLSRFGYDTPVQ